MERNTAKRRISKEAEQEREVSSSSMLEAKVRRKGNRDSAKRRIMQEANVERNQPANDLNAKHKRANSTGYDAHDFRQHLTSFYLKTTLSANNGLEDINN